MTPMVSPRWGPPRGDAPIVMCLMGHRGALVDGVPHPMATSPTPWPCPPPRDGVPPSTAVSPAPWHCPGPHRARRRAGSFRNGWRTPRPSSSRPCRKLRPCRRSRPSWLRGWRLSPRWGGGVPGGFLGGSGWALRGLWGAMGH